MTGFNSKRMMARDVEPLNERIKELALQMGHVATIGNWGRVEWADNIYPQLGDKMYADIDLERFAELIVEEFRNMLADEYRKTPLECCGHFLRADETIAKHFYGVEE